VDDHSGIDIRFAPDDGSMVGDFTAHDAEGLLWGIDPVGVSVLQMTDE
jgi:hypothetical protein